MNNELIPQPSELYKSPTEANEQGKIGSKPNGRNLAMKKH
jgi:hypothetical protein